MKMVYGPVPSRRLGRSLGVNPIPFKTCDYSCVYCQLGRTINMTNQRRDFFPPEKIFDEIENSLEIGDIDYITYVGEGEPTLCKSLGWLIGKVKEMTDIPIAVDTNGSLLYRKDVQKDLLKADVVMPSLDAGSPETFKKINRPYKIDFEKVVQGMVNFREKYEGEIWMEIMMVKGINDSEKELEAIKRKLEKIEPDRIYVNVPIRPPAETWAIPPDENAIAKAHSILGKVVEIVEEETGEFSVEGFKSPEDAILAIIKRHPMREEQVMETLKKFGEGNIHNSLKRLEESGKIKKVKYREKVFWITINERRGEK